MEFKNPVIKDFDSLDDLVSKINGMSDVPDKIHMPLEALKKYHSMIDGVLFPSSPFDPNHLSFNGIPLLEA